MASQEALKSYYTDLLHEHGYISVPISITGADIDPLFQEFKDFLELCEQSDGQKYKDAITDVPPSGERRVGGDYFVARRRKGEVNTNAVNQAPATEDKDVVHIGPRSLLTAEQRLRKTVPGVMRQFLNSCIDLHEAAKSACRPVYKALGLEDIMLAPNKYKDQHVVRLLRYLGSTSLLADLHFDRSTATLAAWESHPGLVGASSDNGWRHAMDITSFEADMETALKNPIPHHSGHAKFFLGAGYRRLPNELYQLNGKLPLLLHGVTNEQPDQERYAAVVFMHPPAFYPGYLIPTPDENGAEDVRNRLLRFDSAYQETTI